MSSGQEELCDVKVDVLIKHKSRRKGKSVEELSGNRSETSRDVDSDESRHKSRRDRSRSQDDLDGGRRKKREVDHRAGSVGAIQARLPETESSDDSVVMRDHKKRSRNYDNVDHGVTNVHIVRHKKRLAVADLSDEEINMVRQQRRRKDEHSGTSSDLTRQKSRSTHSAGAYEGTMKGKPKVANKPTEYVYVNNAYVGSLNSVNEGRRQQPLQRFVNS